MSNIRAYVQDEFENRFKSTDLYARLSQEYDYVIFSKSWEHPTTSADVIESSNSRKLENYVTFSKFWNPSLDCTPRQFYGSPRSRVMASHTIPVTASKKSQQKKVAGKFQSIPEKTFFSAVPFYYLEFLTSKNPQAIYDLGCGWNVFKKYIPNIIGVDTEEDSNFFGDINGQVDDAYIQEHQGHFESVFSINALNFVPLSDLKKTVVEFYSMIAPGGRGWLTLNVGKMIDRDQEKFKYKSVNYLDQYVRSELLSADIEYIVFDVDLTVINEYMNGNVRLVMQQQK